MAFTVGWVHNLHVKDAPTHTPRMLGIAISFSVISIFAVIVRFVVRLRIVRRLGPDDWSVGASCVLAVAYSIVAIVQTRWGQALDPKFFPPQNIVEFSKIQYVGGPLYTLAVLGFKLALLFSYLRYVSHQKTYRVIIYGAIAVCTINQVIFTFLLTLACNPVAKQWDATIPGHCINQLASYFALGGTSLGLDTMIILLPIPILWRLNLSNNRQRLALVAVFGLGLFVTVVQFIRIFTIKNLKTYTNSEAIVNWSIVEMNLGIVVASAPTYAPLFRWATERLKITSSDRRRNGYGYGPGGSTNGGTQGAKNSMIITNSKAPGFNFALDDLRSGNGTQNMKSRIDADAESQEEILKLEDGIRVTTSIMQGDDSDSGERKYHVMDLPQHGQDRDPNNKQARPVPGW